MNRIIVVGTGPDVGKTIVSAILTVLLDADYWKPIQCGDEEHSDTATVRKWIHTEKHQVHSPAYSLKAPLSPHHAARLEHRTIKVESICIPQTIRPLVIESVGGILVPLTTKDLTIDLFRSWNCRWIIVSRHYLGNINHTLLTIEALKQRQIPILGIIFNGEPNRDSEDAILEYSQVPLLERVLPENHLNSETIQRYAQQWQPRLKNLIG